MIDGLLYLPVYDSDMPKLSNARLVLEAFDCISKHVWDRKIQYTGRDWTTLFQSEFVDIEDLLLLVLLSRQLSCSRANVLGHGVVGLLLTTRWCNN